MELRLELIKNSFDALVGALEASRVGSIAVDGDYYWTTDPRRALNPYEQPEMTLGSLSDAVDELRQLTDGSAGAVPHHLVWLGDTLRALGATVRADDLAQE